MPMPTPGARLAPTRRRIVVGLDGSVRAYGWAILEIVDGRVRVLATGCVLTTLADDDRYRADRDGDRLDAIASSILAVLDAALALSTDVVAIIEAPGGAKSAASVKALQSAYGLSRAVCTARRVARTTVQQGAVKLLLAHDRDADKALLVKPVLAITGWQSGAKTKEPREAETDAVAVALTGIEQMGVLGSKGLPPSPPAMTAPAPAARPRGEEREPAVLARAGVAGSPEASRIPGVTSDGASREPAHAGLPADGSGGRVSTLGESARGA